MIFSVGLRGSLSSLNPSFRNDSDRVIGVILKIAVGWIFLGFLING